MNIFENMNDLVARWQVVTRRKFNADELSVCVDNIIVKSKYGKHIRLYYHSDVDGELTYISIPLTPTTEVPVGTKVNLDDCEILVLVNQSGDEITRISINQ